MSASQPVPPDVAQITAPPATSGILVWDRFVRFFHWSLVLSFALAYLSAKAGKNELHAWLGYFIVALVSARLVWGIYGSPYARFSNFIHAPATVMGYLKAIASGQPRRFLGHNPAGGIMVAILLATLVFITLSGLTVLAVIDFDGPLVGLLKPMSDQAAYAAWSSHTYAVNIILLMVGLHLLGVLLASVQHKENLVRAMVTGYKEPNEAAHPLPASNPEGANTPLPVYTKLAEDNKTI
jgi:cytochrome b